MVTWVTIGCTQDAERPNRIPTLSVGTSNTYVVRFTLGDLVIPRVEVILTGLEMVIVGRDVLNQLYLHLDGPHQNLPYRLRLLSRLPKCRLNRKLKVLYHNLFVDRRKKYGAFG